MVSAITKNQKPKGLYAQGYKTLSSSSFLVTISTVYYPHHPFRISSASIEVHRLSISYHSPEQQHVCSSTQSKDKKGLFLHSSGILRRSGRNTIVSTVGLAIPDTVTRRLLPDDLIAIVVTNDQTKSRGVNVPVPPDEQGAKEGLREKVQDTVEDGLGVRGDDVSAFADAPGDGVQDPEERGQRAGHEEDAADV